MSNRIATCVKCSLNRFICGRGLCQTCHKQARETGTLSDYPLYRRSFDENLTLAREGVTVDGCWPWPHVTVEGYPTGYRIDGRFVNAHVASWEREFGRVPHGHQLDHRCHTDAATCPNGRQCQHRRCVNPSHLEPVNPAEQAARRSNS